MSKRLIVLTLLVVCIATSAIAEDVRKAEYVHAVVRGDGLMPWQEPGLSEEEKSFREEIEARKNAMLDTAQPAHPSFYDAAALARAKDNVAHYEWAQQWLTGQVSFADEIASQPEGWIASMIPREAPSHAYGFTCPECVGVKSQEGVGDPIVRWNYRRPDEFSCKECSTVFPNEKYPETVELKLPRTGHSVSYYLNPEEQAHPEDRSGKLAWHWVNYPIHNSFTGIVRERKISFMQGAVSSLGLAYLFTEEPRYAVAVRDILVRLAECYRQWPYRDYWDTYADCDPLYAAWHDKSLPIAWKRHLSEQAYAQDTFEKSAMLQNYWGAGRFHPSTDSVSGLPSLVQAYDFTANALDANGAPIWDADARRLVQGDLFLEWMMGAEPYVGGPGNAEEDNNKSPRIYNAMAALGKCLGIPEYADVALRGYERVRDGSFLYDGFSSESPSYTAMYLAQLLIVPETLHGYPWPSDFPGRTGTVDLYQEDPQLRMMYRSVLDTLLPDGRYLPLSDTRLPTRPPLGVLQKGVRRYPEYYAGLLPNFYKAAGDEYAVFNLTNEELFDSQPLQLAEVYHPAWKTAVLRHGDDRDAATLTLAFNPPGGHRHADNLAIFYAEGGQTLLGDLGYLGDMPVNRWIKSTRSHNLVLVDGQEQDFKDRTTTFSFMATSPFASVVEAQSTAYAQCEDYRRRVVLVKAGANHSFALDLFTVNGGTEHRFRTYSELASSSAPDGMLAFTGVDLPEEPPLPQVGASLAEADIYGLRDVRSGHPEGSAWQAVWQEGSGAYRLWMDTPDAMVEASNGPGQRTHEEAGRRVRYVDTVRRGEKLQSQFVAAHESRRGEDPFLIHSLTRIPVVAGPDAVALMVETDQGRYFVLHRFETSANVADIQFHGEFALALQTTEGRWQVLAIGARHLSISGVIVSEGTPFWRSEATRRDDATFEASSAPPSDWRFSPGVAQAYAQVNLDGDITGFPVAGVDGQRITVSRFPAQPITTMELPAVVYWESDRPRETE